ncbi:MAG: hypothetical protein LBP63_06410 [Prevotellaceae bacterium]|nr:hypothetical protein [Prevotellaceae bacterium]
MKLYQCTINKYKNGKKKVYGIHKSFTIDKVITVWTNGEKQQNIKYFIAV